MFGKAEIPNRPSMEADDGCLKFGVDYNGVSVIDRIANAGIFGQFDDAKRELVIKPAMSIPKLVLVSFDVYSRTNTGSMVQDPVKEIRDKHPDCKD